MKMSQYKLNKIGYNQDLCTYKKYCKYDAVPSPEFVNTIIYTYIKILYRNDKSFNTIIYTYIKILYFIVVESIGILRFHDL